MLTLEHFKTDVSPKSPLAALAKDFIVRSPEINSWTRQCIVEARLLTDIREGNQAKCARQTVLILSLVTKVWDHNRKSKIGLNAYAKQQSTQAG